MELSDTELRALVRESIARHMRPEPPAASRPAPLGFVPPHASHTLVPLARGSDDDGMCLIEPAVRCNRCGYCLSYGH